MTAGSLDPEEAEEVVRREVRVLLQLKKLNLALIKLQSWIQLAHSSGFVLCAALVAVGSLPTGGWCVTSRVATQAPFEDIGAGLPGVYESSVAWGDYDNDGDLDILLTGFTGSEIISRVYRNDSGSFVDLEAGLPGVNEGSVAWGDYDNDGDLDILLTGYTGAVMISRVYRNDAGSFVDLQAGLPGVRWGSVAWGDYDNDGDLDILLTGWAGSQEISRVYRNDAGSFSDIGDELHGIYWSSVAWGDYDNDGDLDILMTGWTGFFFNRLYRNDGGGDFFDIGPWPWPLPGVHFTTVGWGDYDNDGDLDILLAGYFLCRVFRNDAGNFETIAAELPGAQFSSAAWGDYNNDGDLDLLITGSLTSRVYRNEGGNFVDIDAGLPGIQKGSVAWGDYDNDGDLDILLTGQGESQEAVSQIFRNNNPIANTPPLAPTNLNVQLTGNRATFSWDPAWDSESPSASLTYNLRIGTTPGGNEVSGGMADAGTGFRRIPALGNMNHNTRWSIDLPLGGTYYWSLQAVDAAFEGSPFSSEQVLSAPTGVDRIPEPQKIALNPNVPNPFNPTTVISFFLPWEEKVSLVIFDATGRRIRVLVDEELSAGRHEVLWDGSSDRGWPVASGVYFFRMSTGSFSDTKRMTLVE
jgi:predicted nucleotidyltransferase